MDRVNSYLKARVVPSPAMTRRAVLRRAPLRSTALRRALPSLAMVSHGVNQLSTPELLCFSCEGHHQGNETYWEPERHYNQRPVALERHVA